MSLKRNIAANMSSQGYVAAVAVLVLPGYLHLMGPEAFGLVGLFAVLQAWFTLLDLGMVQTASREVARYRAGALTALEYRRILRGFNIVFVGVGGAALIAGWLALPFIAEGWLDARSLPADVVRQALGIMMVTAALRWAVGVQRGIIVGFERQVWLSTYNAVIVSLRFLGVFPVLWWLGPTPQVFFGYQLVIAFVELVVLAGFVRRLTPHLAEPIGFSLAPLRPLVGRSALIAGTALAWFLIPQIDKIILSGTLPLAEFGYFSLATMAAGGLVTFTAPVALALMPNLTRLLAEGQRAEALMTYRRASQFIAVLAGAAAISMAAAAELLMSAWSGDPETAAKTAPILSLYAVGAGLGALSSFAYYLMYAIGRMKLHLVGSVLFLVALLPLMIWLAGTWGAIGAGIAWVAVNGLYLLIWPQVVHARLAPEIASRWIVEDVLAIVVPAGLVGLLLYQALPSFDDRVIALGAVLGVSLIVLAVAALCSSWVRSRAASFIARRLAA